MKKALAILLIFISFLTYSQKKRDTIPPTKHNHALAFEFGGGAGFNWAFGYEYWYRKELQGFGTSVGLGMKGYSRRGGSGNIGEIYNSHIGIHYTVGKWMGLRIGANLAGEINPKAFTGYYNQGGEELSYPLSLEDEYKLPGDGVRKWRTYLIFDIGPYFTFNRGEVYLYPKFAATLYRNENYWHQPIQHYQRWALYGGLTMKFDLAKIYYRYETIKQSRKID